MFLSDAVNTMYLTMIHVSWEHANFKSSQGRLENVPPAFWDSRDLGLYSDLRSRMLRFVDPRVIVPLAT